MMRIFNTLTRKMETFEPLQTGHVRLYTCGPTVYNYAHIGNFRCYLFEDLLRRHLKWRGYRVTQVMNLTDVDDKTIRGAREAGVPLKEFTARYAQSFFEDLKTLNVEPAEHYPAATDHVPEMIALVGRLLEKGFAYRSDDGSVYYNIAKFPNYGRLSHLDLAGLCAGARVAQDEYEKENASDFALWKAWDAEDGDVGWDSPWGKGRPGWHIECSAMSMKYLGETFDLHTGGVDNIFPHHENEIAQSEGATGKPFVRYWMHSAHLVADGKKMSKSLGNFYTLRDVLHRGYEGRHMRYFLLSGQYRQSLNFTFEALDGARAAVTRVAEFEARLREKAGDSDPAREGAPEWAAAAAREFGEALDEDLNAPEALSALFSLVHAGNRALDTGRVSAAEAAGALSCLREMDRVLGVLGGGESGPGREVEDLVARREQARGARDWGESDAIRKRLAEMGWDVRDTPQGPKVKRRGGG